MRTKFWVFFGLLFCLGTAIGLWWYSRHLSVLIDNRFSGRKWQLPARVYSDTTLLYPDQGVNKTLLLEKLYGLNYRAVDQKPNRKGEMRVAADYIEIYLYDASLPTEERTGFPVHIRIQGNRLAEINRLDTKEPLTLLELEPEEVTLFYGPERERRRLVSIRRIPDHLIKAILAAEDERFYQHHGISVTGILRALYRNLSHGEIRQGGSTITQQLAKNYFLTAERTFSRKLQEVLIAILLEQKYDKDEILEIYLNEIYFGQRGGESINGIGEAAFFYFGKPAEELTVAESAAIAGLIKAPNQYSPRLHPSAAETRRNQVLNAMQQNGWLTEKALAEAATVPLKSARFHSRTRKAPYFADYLHQQLTALYSAEDLSSLGLSIRTTLDTQVQMAAEQALENGLKRLETRYPSLRKKKSGERLEGAVVVIQPRTGYVLAMVGGRKYSQSQFNRITQSRRQTGSTFKPFVYLTALDRFTPASLFSNAAKSYPTGSGDWTPQNYEATPETMVSMRTALAHSYNRATVDLAMQTGLAEIIKTAQAFGFSTDLKPYPALALGAFEAIPLELARAYCAFAADGFQPYLLAVKDIIGNDNQPLNRRQIQIKRVLSPAKAYLITSMLQSVVTEGTAKSLPAIGWPFPTAGKTGTTSDYRDAWFVGYTPDILALVWVGFDNGESIHVAGATAALPIWADLVKALPQYRSGNWFSMPAGVVTIKICTESGLPAVESACSQIKEEIFLEENVPSGECPLHGGGLFQNLLKGINDLVQ